MKRNLIVLLTILVCGLTACKYTKIGQNDLPLCHKRDKKQKG